MDYSGSIYRPVSISIWEPAKNKLCSKQLAIKDYLRILKNEEEYESLPFEYFFDWFYIPPSDHNINNAEYLTKAITCYDKVDLESPVVIYSASFGTSSTENFILCEYLASLGYRVVAIPSKGNDNKYFNGSIKDAAAQSRDVDFVIANLSKLGINRADNIYLSGFSYGGLSHILSAANNHLVKGVISLDGTIKYKPELLKDAYNFDISDFLVPFIHFSQKDISHEMLKKESLDSAINHNFYFYDSIPSPVKYQIKSNYLRHAYFSSYGILFSEHDPLQDGGGDKIIASYEKLLSLFRSSLQYLSTSNPADQINSNVFISELTGNGLFKVVDFAADTRAHFTFADHIAISKADSFFNLGYLFDSIVIIDPDYYPQEGDLNTLGLQHIFTKSGYQSGVNIFKFALRLFPDSANLYDSLAEGYRYHGDTALAIESFEKSLSLNPENLNAVRRLDELRNGE